MQSPAGVFGVLGSLSRQPAATISQSISTQRFTVTNSGLLAAGGLGLGWLKRQGHVSWDLLFFSIFMKVGPVRPIKETQKRAFSHSSLVYLND